MSNTGFGYNVFSMATVKSKPRKGVAYSKRKLEILEAAAYLFVKKGYLKTTTRDIANRCGMSIGHLYYYVPSKADLMILFIEMNNQWQEELIKEIEKILNKSNPLTALKETIRYYALHVDKYQDIFVFWYQESKNLEPEFRRLVLGSFNRTSEKLQLLIEKGCKQGYFKCNYPRLVATNIEVLITAWAFRRWDLRHDYNLDNFIKDQTDFIVKALRSGKW